MNTPEKFERYVEVCPGCCGSGMAQDFSMNLCPRCAGKGQTVEQLAKQQEVNP